MLDSRLRGNDIERSGNDKSPLFTSVLEFLGNTNLLPLNIIGTDTHFLFGLAKIIDGIFTGGTTNYKYYA